MARCFRNSVMEKALFIFCSNCVEYSYQDKQAVFTSLFNSISENFHILLLKSVLLTSVASCSLRNWLFFCRVHHFLGKINKTRDSHFQIKCPCYNRVGVKTKWFALSIHRARAHFPLSRAQNSLWRVHLKSRFKLLMIQCSSPIVGFIYSVCRSLQLSPVVVHV